jgi:hypothetical protein
VQRHGALALLDPNSSGLPSKGSGRTWAMPTQQALMTFATVSGFAGLSSGVTLQQLQGRMVALFSLWGMMVVRIV